MQGAFAAMPRIVRASGMALIAFAAAEIGQHVVEAPARTAEPRPFVVVVAVSTNIDHAVDRRTASQSASAWLKGAASVKAVLRLG